MSTRLRSRAGSLAALLGLALWVSSHGAIAAESASTTSTAGASVRGRVTLSLPDVNLADLGPVIVYMEPLDGELPPPDDRHPPAVVQRGAKFEPAFLVIERGQRVSMPNADAIYHNVFSFSKPNDFDLGLYPAGESRFVRLEHAGVVKIYCSIHESMSATIFVSPSPHFARLAPSGRFHVDGVPPGRYRISLWCERLPGMTAELVVPEGGLGDFELQWSPLAG